MRAPILPVNTGSFAGSTPLPQRYHMRCRTEVNQYMLTVPSALDDGGYFLSGYDSVVTPPPKMAYYNSAGTRVWVSTDVTGTLSTATDGGKLSYMSDGAYYGLLAGTSTAIALHKLANPYVNSTLTKLAQYTLTGVSATNARSNYAMQEQPDGNIKIIYQTDSGILRNFIVSKAGVVVTADNAYIYGGNLVATSSPIYGSWYETKDGILINTTNANTAIVANNRYAQVSLPFMVKPQFIYTHFGHLRFTTDWVGVIPEGNGFIRADFDTYIYNIANSIGLLKP